MDERRVALAALATMIWLGAGPVFSASPCSQEATKSYREGRRLFIGKEYGKAEQELRRAKNLCPGHALTLTYLGLALARGAASVPALQRKAKLDEARDLFQRALGLRPGLPRVNMAFGTLYMVGGDYASAEVKFQQAVSKLERLLEIVSNEQKRRAYGSLLRRARDGLQVARSLKTGMANELSEEELLLRFLPTKANERPRIPFKIQFAFDSPSLEPDGRKILDRVARVLSRPVFDGSVYEVGGHTDQCGDANYNQLLSEKRAKVVRKYLVTKGVPSSRLQARGYGKAAPLLKESKDCRAMTRAQKDADSVLAKNRRTEFTYLGGQ